MEDSTTVDMLPMWPIGAGPDYIAARVELARTELALHDRITELAAARRALPDGVLLADYVLAEGPLDLGLPGPTQSRRLTELFGDHQVLVIYHLMFHPDEDEACSMCSMWVDGFHGVSHHLAQHAAFVVVAKAPLPKLRAWALRRGWDGLRVLSSYGTTFNADLWAEHSDGSQRPMISVLRREGDRARHFYSLPANHLDDSEGAIDLLSPVWNVLDLMPGGRGDWYAANGYAGRTRG